MIPQCIVTPEFSAVLVNTRLDYIFRPASYTDGNTANSPPAIGQGLWSSLCMRWFADPMVSEGISINCDWDEALTKSFFLGVLTKLLLSWNNQKYTNY